MNEVFKKITRFTAFWSPPLRAIPKKKSGRKLLLKELDRMIVEHDLFEEKICDCGYQKTIELYAV
jgi:hypothetical protein